MNVNQKANLIVEFYKTFRSDPKYGSFFSLCKYGVSVAVYAIAGMDTQDDLYDSEELDDLSSDDVDQLIRITWERLCHEFDGINPDLEFDSLSEFMDYKKPSVMSVNEIVERISIIEKSEIFKFGKYSAWSTNVFEEVLPIAFSKESDGDLRLFVYGALSGVREMKCYCSKEHNKRFEPFEEMISHIQIEELPETGHRVILSYMLVRAAKSGKLDMLMDDDSFENYSAINFDEPKRSFTTEGKLDSSEYEPYRDFIELAGKNFDEFMEATSQNFLEMGNFVFTNLRFIESDMLLEGGDELDQAIEEYEFLRDEVHGIAEEDFVNFVYEFENWYPRALYTAVANRSSRFPGKIPEGTETRWNYDLSGEPPGYFPLELQEILSLIPRLRAFSQNEKLGEVLEDCFYVFIDPMPALVATRPETPDEKRIEIIKAYADPTNGFDFSEFDEQVGSEETYSNSLEVTAAALYVEDIDALTLLNGTDSTLIKHAIFLNPALPAEIRTELSKSLDLDYIKEDLEGFISAAEESRDLDFADLLKTFRG